VYNLVFYALVLSITSYQDYDFHMSHGPIELMSAPAHWTPEQIKIVDTIINESSNTNDTHLLVAIAVVESNLRPAVVNWETRDVGLFQINYHWHHARVGVKTFTAFCDEMTDPVKNTRYAIFVVKDMRRYRGCKGINLPACYNGGPGWNNSKNRLKIQAYRDRVNQLARGYKKTYPDWGINVR
jgi:hypothetical protein